MKIDQKNLRKKNSVSLTIRISEGSVLWEFTCGDALKSWHAAFYSRISL